MATIVHAADLHIDSPVRAPGSPLATRQAVGRLLELVVTERADLLVIAGDVFDRGADSVAAGRFFASQTSRLAGLGVPVLVAAGNHDALCPLATGVPGDARWFPTTAPASFRLDALGVAVHGQGLADPAEPADLSAGFPDPVPGMVNIGVLHTSLDGRNSRSTCAPTSTAALAASGYDYWALGHVHQRQVLATEPWIVFPGNLPGRGPAGCGGKGATVITTEAGAITRIAHRDLAAPRWPVWTANAARLPA